MITLSLTEHEARMLSEIFSSILDDYYYLSNNQYDLAENLKNKILEEIEK